jgi:hypothetical protein
MPITLRYQATAEAVGLPGRAAVHLSMPLSWLLPGSSNLAWGKVQRSMDLAGYGGYSRTNGIGVVTLALCIAGLWIGRRRPEMGQTRAR